MIRRNRFPAWPRLIAAAVLGGVIAYGCGQPVGAGATDAPTTVTQAPVATQTPVTATQAPASTPTAAPTKAPKTTPTKAPKKTPAPTYNNPY